jgi:NAD-dependent deacetylase
METLETGTQTNTVEGDSTTGWPVLSAEGEERQSPASHAEAIGRVADLLAASHSILFITGAGISADSGLPTYRGAGGFYRLDTTEDGIPLERALSGDLLADHPELTWKYLARLEKACRGVCHNRAHEVLAEMERHFERVLILTQNVTGLHRAAGARNVLDIHGDLHDLRCTRCRYRRTVADYDGLTLPPRCPQCPGLLRPDIVLFGETLALEKLATLFTELDRGFDLVFTIGTSSVFPYIAEPVRIAAVHGRPVVEINPGTSEVSDLADIKLPLRAAPALDAIWQAYQRRSPAVPRVS